MPLFKIFADVDQSTMNTEQAYVRVKAPLRSQLNIRMVKILANVIYRSLYPRSFMYHLDSHLLACATEHAIWEYY